MPVVIRTALLAALCSLICSQACLVVEPTYDKLPPGVYRGVLLLDGRQSQRREPDEVAARFALDEVARGELPFLFEIAYDSLGELDVTLINGDERIAVPDVTYERLLDLARDSITIRFPLNDSYLTAYHEDGIIEGTFVDEARPGDYRIPFNAVHGEDYRFTQLRKAPVADLSGRWAAEFGVDDTTSAYPAVGEFEQRGNQLRGTFLTPTGDYRFLTGTVQGDRAYLSTFDGAHAFLFAAKLQADSSLLGLFRSGDHYQTIWTATRDSDAALPDPLGQTEVLDPEAPVELIGLRPSGEQLDVADLPGRLTVVSLFGSWCPNCRDEAVFLDSMRRTFRSGEVSFVGAGFEYFADTARALAAIDRFGESLGLDYPLMLVGSSDKAAATERLGFLDEVRSFPTLLILDERQRVVYVHTGFAGPATGAYGDFTRAFAQTLETLLAT